MGWPFAFVIIVFFVCVTIMTLFGNKKGKGGKK